MADSDDDLSASLAARLEAVRHTQEDIAAIALASAKSTTLREVLGEDAAQHETNLNLAARGLHLAVEGLLNFILEHGSPSEQIEAVLNVSRVMTFVHDINARREPGPCQTALVQKIGAARSQAATHGPVANRHIWAAQLAFRKREELGKPKASNSDVAKWIAGDLNKRLVEAGVKAVDKVRIEKDLGSPEAKWMRVMLELAARRAK
jgi:hypothetical protein